MKRTYQPKKRQRMRMSGFRARMKKAPHILKSRRQKGRWKLAVTLS
jgi:large subunit ribosomal protein L34